MQSKVSMKPGILSLIIIAILLVYLPILKADPIEGIKVELKILDKISAKVKNININVGEVLNFENLEINITVCYKNPPEEIPEDFVLLKIYDEIIKKNIKNIFQGWMISSSPAVTPLEHPIYDLWVKSCNNDNDLS